MIDALKQLGIDTVVFDMDGTLVETEDSYRQILERILDRYGLKMTQDQANFIRGRTWTDGVSKVHRELNPPISHEAFYKEASETHYHELQTKLRIVPGAKRAVEKLAKNFNIALVSGSSRAEIDLVLKSMGIAKHFQFTIAHEDVSQGKPHPEGYLGAIERLGSIPQKTMIFEDSRAGVQAARSAGAWVIAVRPQPTLDIVDFHNTAWPDFVIPNFEAYF